MCANSPKTKDKPYYIAFLHKQVSNVLETETSKIVLIMTHVNVFWALRKNKTKFSCDEFLNNI